MDCQRTLQSVAWVALLSWAVIYFPDVLGKETYYVSGPDMVSVTCPTGEGWYRNPFDCNKFYACVPTNLKDYFVYEYDCPEGLHYDLNRTMCDYPWDVKPKCDVPDIPTTTRRPYKLRFSMPPENKPTTAPMNNGFRDLQQPSDVDNLPPPDRDSAASAPDANTDPNTSDNAAVDANGGPDVL